MLFLVHLLSFSSTVPYPLLLLFKITVPCPSLLLLITVPCPLLLLANYCSLSIVNPCQPLFLVQCLFIVAPCPASKVCVLCRSLVMFFGSKSTTELCLGPVGMAAAAAIVSSKKRKRPHSFETNPSIRKRQQNRLLRKLRVSTLYLRQQFLC